MLGNPYVILATVIFLGISHSFAFYKGYDYRDVKAKAELAKEYKEKIEALEAYDKISREFVKAYQKEEQQTKIVYRTIKEKVKDETVGRVCFDDGANRLWNDALEGSVPETPTRTTEEATSSYSDEVVLRNAIDNFEQYKDCRNQLNGLIDWYELNNKEK